MKNKPAPTILKTSYLSNDLVKNTQISWDYPFNTLFWRGIVAKFSTHVFLNLGEFEFMFEKAFKTRVSNALMELFDKEKNNRSKSPHCPLENISIGDILQFRNWEY
jgi:hypothetical protein